MEANHLEVWNISRFTLQLAIQNKDGSEVPIIAPNFLEVLGGVGVSQVGWKSPRSRYGSIFTYVRTCARHLDDEVHKLLVIA